MGVEKYLKRTYAEFMQELEEKWTVENVTALLDEMNIEYELVEEEGEQKVSINEMKEQEGIKYRLKNESTGQYVSYLGVAEYKDNSILPKTIDAIEYTRSKEESTVFHFTERKKTPNSNPLGWLKAFYKGAHNLVMEQVEEDERFLFYSEDLDTYFDYISIDTALNGATSFRLDSVPHESLSTHDLRESGTKDSKIIELFEQNTSFLKVKVSDLD